jgi:hypothetical protein
MNTRKQFLILLISVVLSEHANSQLFAKLFPPKSFDSQVILVPDQTNANVITMKVIGSASNQINAEEDAAKDCFRTIFFRGVPQSSYSSPLIGTQEINIVNSNEKYFKTFFEGKRYLSFLVSRNCGSIVKVNKRIQVTCLISVNVSLLKEDLKNYKLITDYGF